MRVVEVAERKMELRKRRRVEEFVPEWMSWVVGLFLLLLPLLQKHFESQSKIEMAVAVAVAL